MLDTTGRSSALLLLMFFVFLISGCARHAEKDEHNIIKSTVQQGTRLEGASKKSEIKKQERQKTFFVQKGGEKRKVYDEPSLKTRVPTITCTRQKKMKMNVMVLNGRDYAIPKVWRGHRITEKSPDLAHLTAIPEQYTYHQTLLYLEKGACRAFVRMAEQAARDGIELKVHSGFRSKGYQKKIFEQQLAKGRSFSDVVRFVAPPGYSEHALGVAIDLYPSDWRFSSTPMYQWMVKNAARFGFSESYPHSSPQGFPWEAWHWRYRRLSGDSQN